MLRVSGWLFAVLVVLMFMKYAHDRRKKEEAERTEAAKQEAAAKQVKEEVNWEERLLTIVPKQEDLLAPNVIPQILIPPLYTKIEVPRSLEFERTKLYSAAYELRPTAPAQMWSVSSAAAASPINTSTSIHTDIPALAPPLSSEASKPRAPKPYRGLNQTYILLP